MGRSVITVEVEQETAMDARRVPRRRTTFVLAVATALIAGGCSQTPTRTVSVPQAAPQPLPLYVYPASGQVPAQLDRDRYECHLWAVRQARFDPSLPGIPSAQRVEVVRTSPPPGTAVAAGAFSGAVLGAAVASPWNTGEGALIGAAAGAMVGAVAESAAAEESRRIEQARIAQQAAASAQSGGHAADYRRALTACLEARGYSVR
jgi:hypothetical protein